MSQEKNQGNRRRREQNKRPAGHPPTKMRGPRDFVGRLQHVDDVAEAYRSVSVEDEEAARVLQREGRYRQAVYFFMQAMEKLVRYAIFSEVSPDGVDKEGTTYRERTTTHNLDDLLAVLLEVYRETINDSRVSEQIENQLATYVLEGVQFGFLHNDVRYPRYVERHRSYSLLELRDKDAEATSGKLARLKSFV